MSKAETIICTVGTSLLESNLKSLPDTEDNFHKLLAGRYKKDSDYLQSRWKEVQETKNLYLNNQDQKLGQFLASFPDDLMLNGAEINSIGCLLKRKDVDLRRLIFLVSDTLSGLRMGEILKAYYMARQKELGLKFVDYQTVKGMQDEHPGSFRAQGLRNLVREIGKIIYESGGAEKMAINATGGYKAQIAVAVLIGQALDMPVYYKHERFNDIISFPPMPVSLDYSLVGRYGDLLSAFERGCVLSSDEIGQDIEKIRPLLEEVEIDGQLYWELGAIGQIYLTGYRLRNPKPPYLKELTDESRKLPTLSNHGYGGKRDDFKDFVNRVWREFRWIKTCVSAGYHSQSSIRKTGFRIECEGNGKQEIIGEWKDDKIGLRFKVITTAQHEADLIWAVDQLNQRFGE
ncbi:hypothetical protein P378_19160 [Desulforamulus profundi]|uniref:CRISPR system ring nuclease SSO1393-like domain-containing protein n=1 Tax=Desulforamulus profundi TaxID=1383067 RepID=A0A2C6LG82_9FIRM|nr:putative CRISPR-associated protein [Desulforamulus profundi]PHJ36970.1 hypothetical protein P378_19160 [Desulforamulus profundi]